MEATPPPASPVPEGTAPPGDLAAAFPPPSPRAFDRARGVLGFAGALVALAVAFAGYRLYEKDRAETAAELVRIRAYLDARAQAEAVPVQAREKARAPVAPVAPLAAASVDAKPRPRIEPAVRVAPKPRPAKPKPSAQPHPKQVTEKPRRPAVQPVERPKNVDRIWSERVERECSPGFVGLICREWLKFDLCRAHDAWGKASICPAAEKPPPAVMSGSLG